MELAATESAVAQVKEARTRLFNELRKVIVGQEEALEHLALALLARGHVLLTGVPGLGKTLLVKSLAQCFSLDFKRIQFTPDLMPADILGAEVMDEDATTGKRAFRFVRGPLFTQVLLADEINRTPPKTQAALLEAMGERQVTAAGQSLALDAPFFVIATQNPVELEGTYPLPEAQLDRFLLNSVLSYLPAEDEVSMVSATTSPKAEAIEPVLNGEEVLALQKLVTQVPAAEHVVRYAVNLVAASRPSPHATAFVRENIKWGAGSRASQALILTGKARALLDGRYNVAVEDVRALAPAVLRHRLIPSFHAEAEGLTPDDIIRHLIETVSE